MEKNKPGKYLKYAIGEIFLVIIGILIALQINNWNEKRIEKIELDVALYSMIDELNQNIRFLEVEKADKQNKLLALDKINEGTSSDKDMRQIIPAFSEEVNSKEFTNIYISLKEEKKIRLIRSKIFRDQITAFYEYHLADIRDFSDWHEKFVRDNIDTFILDNLPLDDNFETSHETVKELLTQFKFRNILTYQEQLYGIYISSNENVTQLANELKVAIESHLNK